jgi:hypothetical protein
MPSMREPCAIATPPYQSGITGDQCRSTAWSSRFHSAPIWSSGVASMARVSWSTDLFENASAFAPRKPVRSGSVDR